MKENHLNCEKLLAENKQLKSQLKVLQKKEEELKQYKDILDKLTDPVMLKDTNGRYQVINKAVSEFVGLPGDQIIGKNDREIFGETVGRKMWEEEKQALLKETVITYEEQLPTKKGERFFKTTRVPYYTLDGKVTGITSICRDFTKQKMLEKELLKKHNALENSIAGLVITDMEANIEYANPEVLKMFGYKRREVEGHNIMDAERYKSHARWILKNIKDKGSWKGEMTVTDKAGNALSLLVYASYIKDEEGDSIGIQSTLINISERFRAEKATKQAYHFNQQVINNLGEGIVVYDTSLRYKVWNPFMEQITGKSTLEVLGRSAVDVFPHIKDYGLDQLMEKALKGEQVRTPDVPFKVPHTGKSGWVSALYTPLIDQEGRVTGMIAIINDISERKESEKKLKIAKEKAEENNRLKSAFLANMSHEIRTPMNGIMGFSELLQQKEYPRSKQKRFLNVIHMRTKQLLRIINDLVDISKIEMNQLSLRNQHFNLNEVMKELHAIYQNEIKIQEKSGVQLIMHNELTHKDSDMLSDPHRFRQIMDNLLSNAIKFTPHGTIEFGYQKSSKDFMLFYVKDPGIGIPKDKQQIIFERFRQADDSTNRLYEGTGLGLTISKNLVDLMGGKMWLRSEPQKGSVFYFTLPYSAPPLRNGNKAKPKEYKPSHEKAKTLLIIEDDPASRDYLKELLEPESYNLILCDTGAKGYDAVTKNPDIDLILMDIKLPDIDGLELTRRIRSTLPERKIPVIAQTAYAMSEDAQKSLEAGCNDYISKPVHIQELQEKICKWVYENNTKTGD